jgi:hypothetical protein
MRIKKLVTSLAFLTLAFAVIGVSFFPSSASASESGLCGGFSRLNRGGCTGYFTGTYFYGTYGVQGQNIIDCTKGPSVCTGGEAINNAIPSGVTDGPTFISWVQGYLFNSAGTSYNYNKAGAAFIVDAMLGRWGTDYGTTAAGISYAQAHFGQWSSAVQGYDDLGWVTWDQATTLPTDTINSLHACWPSIPDCTTGNISSNDSHDFAFFRNPDAEASHIITFHNPNGSTFQIRRECGNLLGSISPLTLPNFNLTPTVSATVNGTASSSAEPGDTIKFTYSVSNSGTLPSTNTACSTYANTYAGYYTPPGSPSPGGPAGPNPGCPRDFYPGGTTIATDTVVPATGSQTICRSLFVNPATYGGGQVGDETCVIVASKPYFKVFGGDLSVGAGLTTGASCTDNNNAAIISWNQRAASYAGAGAQYAVYALSTITDFAGAQNLSGGAAEPAGLSFANTATNIGSGNFGGSYGSVGCIPDYYSRKPASTQPLPADVSSMVTNAYASNTGISLTGGNVNPGNKISVYVNGDVYITSDISYPGTWSTNNMPLFELVAKGNIYISSNVHRLDGVYIAQQNGATGGTIYTCATSAAPIAIANGAFYNTCNSKLVINGAFVSNSIELLRTAASLKQSSAGETSSVTGAGTNAAEVFNFNPTIWLVQPLDTSGTVDNYDAITSLPPVL